MLEKNNKPLEGVKVLDFTIALAGVYVSWQLADYGAEVWKVERFKAGDQSRTWGPFINDLSTLYAAYNKNKKSIEIDLSQEKGKEIIYKLVKEADIVLENFKSGSIDRLGLGYEKLREINPKIVFLSLSGFGNNGPLKKLPCYDAIAAARGGFAASNGEPDGAPMKAANANCDTLTGTYGVNAVLMALIDAQKTGVGSHIDLAMTDTAMISCVESITDYDNGSYKQARFGNHDRFISPYGLFETRDGWIAIIADSEERWESLCHVLDRKDLLQKEEFKDNQARINNLDDLVEELEKSTILFKRNELEKLLLEKDVPASEVLPFIEAYTSDHANATACSELVEQNKIGMLRFYNNPLKFNDEKCPIWAGAPLLGEHTIEVLKDSGYTEQEIKELFDKEIVAKTLI